MHQALFILMVALAGVAAFVAGRRRTTTTRSIATQTHRDEQQLFFSCFSASIAVARTHAAAAQGSPRQRKSLTEAIASAVGETLTGLHIRAGPQPRGYNQV